MHWPPDAIPRTLHIVQHAVRLEQAIASAVVARRIDQQLPAEPGPQTSALRESAADFTSSLMSRDTPGKLTKTDIDLHQITNGRAPSGLPSLVTVQPTQMGRIRPVRTIEDQPSTPDRISRHPLDGTSGRLEVREVRNENRRHLRSRRASGPGRLACSSAD